MKHAGWLLPVAKRRRGLGTSPQAGGLGDEIPHRFPLSRSDLEKSSQRAKRNLTVNFRVTLFDLRFIRNKGWLAEF